MLNGFIIASIILSIFIMISVIIFGGMEKLTERFPKLQNFFLNMFDEDK